jgi:oxygen-independent coproporphyrinogen-3 oxidase
LVFRKDKQSLKLFIKYQIHLAGIYIHIPFCKQACHYCNFHFSISLHYKNELLSALLKETELQKEYLTGERIETIYFGGGTPSLLSIENLKTQMEAISEFFPVDGGAEITLETNPDDISAEKLEGWKAIGINRLSIGIQSFWEEDLAWMNRAHNAQQAITGLQLAIREFENITIDLIYGTPFLTNDSWKQNVETAISLGIPHLSCYALTVEEKTPLSKLIREHKKENINPEKQSEQFLLLMQWMEEAGYEHYEISNFAKPGFRSRHNSSYWQGKKYVGLGPSAHSFNGISRQWNISNNSLYIESIGKGIIPFSKEDLTATQQLNEYIMTSLRTSEGLYLSKFEENIKSKLLKASKKYRDAGLMKEEKGFLILTKEGKLWADGIAAALFF